MKARVTIWAAVGALVLIGIVGLWRGSKQQGAPLPQPGLVAETQAWPVGGTTEAPGTVVVNSRTGAPADLERARMRRMAENLLKPELSLNNTAAAELRSRWGSRFAREHDPLARMEIITEMPQLDDPNTLRQLLALVAREQHSGVRQQIVLILGFMRTTTREPAAVTEALRGAYNRTSDFEEREGIIEVLSNLPTPDSVGFIAAAFAAAVQTPAERLTLAAGLFKLAPRVAVDATQLRETTEWLRCQARSAASEPDRLAAARVLAAPGQDNRSFLAELLATETDSKTRDFLAMATQHYPTR